MKEQTALSLSSVVVASTEQISCDVADEAVLLSMKSGEYFGLNVVGADIWKAIQRPRRVQEVRDELLLEFANVTPEECAGALFDFLEEMHTLGLVDAS